MNFEQLMAFRDAVFWWLGVWAAMTMGNNAIRCIIASRKERQRKEHEEYCKEFFAEMKRRHAEEDAEASETPESHDETPQA